MADASGVEWIPARTNIHILGGREADLHNGFYILTWVTRRDSGTFKALLYVALVVGILLVVFQCAHSESWLGLEKQC